MLLWWQHTWVWDCSSLLKLFLLKSPTSSLVNIWISNPSAFIYFVRKVQLAALPNGVLSWILKHSKPRGVARVLGAVGTSAEVAEPRVSCLEAHVRIQDGFTPTCAWHILTPCTNHIKSIQIHAHPNEVSWDWMLCRRWQKYLDLISFKRPLSFCIYIQDWDMSESDVWHILSRVLNAS